MIPLLENEFIHKRKWISQRRNFWICLPLRSLHQVLLRSTVQLILVIK
ncbi:MAG: hypothetical protein V8Q57_02510 [Blautia sp.]